MRCSILQMTSASVVMLMFASCAKETLNPVPIELPSFKVESGMLHFETTEDYRTMTDMPSEPLRAAFLSKVKGETGFTSANRAAALGAKSSDTDLLFLIDDPYFKEMLNEHLCVWIDDHIFRVNPEDGKVYVIPSSEVGDKYDDLVAQNTGDQDVREYPIDVNVLDVVDDPQALWPFCNESGIPSKYDQELFNDNSGITASATYAKYGIYFTVFAKIDPIGSSNPTYDFYFKGGVPGNEGHVYYRQKCGNTVDYNIRSSGTWYGTYRKYQSYQGSKGLNKLYFFFKPIMSDCPDPTGEVAGSDWDPCAQPFKSNEWIGFRHNY